MDKELIEKRTDLDRHIKEPATRQAELRLESEELTRCHQELERRLEKVRDGPIEKTRRSLGFSCTVEKELMDIVQSSLE